jgi:hypothetical protein
MWVNPQTNVLEFIRLFEEAGYIVIQDINKEKLLVVKNGNKKHNRIREDKQNETKKEKIKEFQSL